VRAWISVLRYCCSFLPAAGLAIGDTQLAEKFVASQPVLAVAAGQPRIGAAAFARGVPLMLADGRLMMVFGDNESGYSHAAALWVAFSGDAGRTWSAAREVERNPEIGVRHGRPAAIQGDDGTIWIFYFGWLRYDGTPEGSRSDVWLVCSRDGGRTFGERRRIWTGYTGMLSGAIRTRAGNLILPLSHLARPQEYRSGCLVSIDDGVTWRHSAAVALGDADRQVREETRLSGGALEPSVAELGDGRILMTIRTVVGRLFTARSQDGGMSWSPPEETPLSCGGTQYLARLSSGRLALVWNPANESRRNRQKWPNGYDAAAVAFSEDDGGSWSPPQVFARAAAGRRAIHSLLVEIAPGELLFTLPEDGLLLRAREAELVSGKRSQ
jgi:sialidase-1